MLGYRTIFDVPTRREDVEAVAMSQLRSWLQSKRLDADALTWGERVPLSTDTTGFLQELDGGDESRSVRARVVESKKGARWTSTLTVHIPGDRRRDPWVWVDIDGPDGQVAGIPRLARNLLEVFSDARTDIAHLRPVPEIIPERGVGELADFLLDDARRRLIFVAGSDSQMPMSRWQELLGDILKDTVGLASAFVLDAEATDALNEVLGPTHAVFPGTVRTFVDHVGPGDAIDAQRHRVLTTQRIVRGDARTVGRVLGLRARAVALGQPLPRAAIRVDRLLERQVDALVLEHRPASAAVAPETVVAVAAPETHAPSVIEPSVGPDVVEQIDGDPVVEREVAESAVEEDVVEGGRLVESELDESRADVVRSAEAILAIHRIGSEVLGVDDLAPRDVDRIIELARRGAAAEQQQHALSERLTELQDQVESTNDEVDRLKMRLEDEQLEVATAAHDLQEAERLVRHLRGLIVQTGAAADAWADPELAPDDLQPASFDEVLSRFDELPRVVLTMSKPELALALDVQNPLGTWAAKAWQVLLTLRDYAQCKNDGSWTKDVDGYLRDTPAGCRTFSATRHARDESETVKSSAKFRAARDLPVPSSVAASGTAFMGAHFKIAQSGLISPRLHYLDATGIDGNVYVGYIGPHLPTKQTN